MWLAPLVLFGGSLKSCPVRSPDLHPPFGPKLLLDINMYKIAILVPKKRALTTTTGMFLGHPADTSKLKT